MKLGTSLSVVFAGVFAASVASAATVDLRFDSGTSNGTAKITKAPVAPIGGYKSYGAYGFNMTDTTGALGSFVAFCLDITHYLSTGTSPYLVTSTPFSNSYGLDPAAKSRVQAMFDANYAGLDTSDRKQAASFQAALWNSIYDADATVAKGAFKATGTDVSLANGYLASAAAFTGPSTYRLTFLESLDGRQNLVTASAVPLPAGGVLLLSAIAGIGAVRRRRKAA